jgi:hypothetical protein
MNKPTPQEIDTISRLNNHLQFADLNKGVDFYFSPEMESVVNEHLDAMGLSHTEQHEIGEAIYCVHIRN